MEATDILIEEHRIIERVLSALESQTRRLETGSAVRPGFFQDATAFFRNFTDGCHHRKEEEAFLMAMMDTGLSNQTGPLAIMLAEHERARAYNRAIEKAAHTLERGESAARDDLIRNALDYASLARQHIRRENEFLFPTADRLIPPLAQKALAAEFERFEHAETGSGIHQKYRRLSDAMEKEAANPGE
ncbi:MAG: hemerythrin domain-containing protein [Anaerolineales bacterium]|nr:hemerythrin domain-containing protein [Anaerolineales bacterium]